jgi:signal transduction histidine kinase
VVVTPRPALAQATAAHAEAAFAAAYQDALEQSRREGVDPQEASELLHALIQAAVQAAAGRPLSEGPIDARTRSIIGRRLLELLASSLLRHAHDGTRPLPAEETLELLRGLEEVRAAIEPNWGQHFASRLAGPGGLELVVELAHDLRSPLTSILFLAETLQRGQSGDVNDVQRRQLRLIYSAALGLSTLASDALELAREGDRLVDQDPAPFSVTEIFQSVRDIVRPMAEEKGLTIRLLPADTDHRLGHPIALSRVLLNLTTNALKFTEEGFVELVAQARGLTRLEFSVRDTGHGINSEALPTLYQPFRRSRSHRGGYCFSGTGLGLAICRRLVEAMGGELLVESRPSWGTRFHFALDLPPATPLVAGV